MQRFKDNSLKTIMYGSVLALILILFMIIGFVFKNGAGEINIDFLTQKNDDVSYYVTFKAGEEYNFKYSIEDEGSKSQVVITQVEKNTKVVNNNDDSLSLKEGVIIDNIDKQSFKGKSSEQINQEINNLMRPDKDYYVKITYPQNGIRELILTTLLAVFVSLAISVPLGLFAAIYLQEYKVSPRLNKWVHFAIDSLAAIPSIVFGLFGFIFFCITLNLGISLLSAVLTISIMLLPTIIKTIEEALIAVPNDLREASLGLGATKYQTIFRVVLPAALPGILLAVILATGRIIGESAIFIFTAGTTVTNPSLFGQSATLTVHAYEIVKEYNEIQSACAIGIVILIIILVLNLITKYISKKYN